MTNFIINNLLCVWDAFAVISSKSINIELYVPPRTLDLGLSHLSRTMAQSLRRGFLTEKFLLDIFLLS